MKNFKQELYELLTIQAPSGKEAKVRKYLAPKLNELVDDMFVDEKGNLLATKKCGDGNGATVILSAHMDSVSNVQKGRKVIEKDGTFYSTKGILGADDRAGIAIIMTVLRNIDNVDFNGTIKVAFCVEEEIGCRGSSAMDVKFYKGADLAIVVDRRGNRDIVTGCGTPNNFCSEKVGKFFEDCSALLGMDWKAVGGGISDATTFSENGVHSVNLSAGYRNEHTEREYVVIQDAKDTIQLVLQALALINGFAGTFGDIPKYDYYSSYNYGSWSWDEEDAYWAAEEAKAKGLNITDPKMIDEDVIYEDKDESFGNIIISDLGGYVSVFQDEIKKDGHVMYAKQEILMTAKQFENMVDSYLIRQAIAQREIKKANKQAAAKAARSKYDGSKKAQGAPSMVNKAVSKSYTVDHKGELLPM